LAAGVEFSALGNSGSSKSATGATGATGAIGVGAGIDSGETVEGIGSIGVADCVLSGD
jgi:hypothetical protein